MLAAKRRLIAFAITVVAAITGAASLTGYYFENKIAWSGPVTMQLQLGPSDSLIDGAADWDQSAADALELWNRYLKSPVQFKFVRGSTAPIRKSDKNNNVFFGDDVFGEPFPAGTAAVTLLRWSGSRMSDADVVFNRGFSYNSYRGPNQGSVLDFRRVALHEFGHVLGLNHPDVAGQAVSAIMNSVVGDTDEPQPDDVQGVESIYGQVEARSVGTRLTAMLLPHARAGLIGFPPRGDAEAFGAELDAKFGEELQRPASVTFVDGASAALWTQEYIRYRTGVLAYRRDSADFHADGRAGHTASVRDRCRSRLAAARRALRFPQPAREQVQRRLQGSLTRHVCRRACRCRVAPGVSPLPSGRVRAPRRQRSRVRSTRWAQCRRHLPLKGVTIFSRAQQRRAR